MIDACSSAEMLVGVAALVASTSRMATVADHAMELLRHDRAAVQPLERRILLVHDSPGVMLVLAAALDHLGVPVDRAHSVAEARVLARRHRPLVAVLDYDLGPGQPSGIALAREIGRGPHVVIVTGHADLDRLVALARDIRAEVLPLALDIDHPALVELVRGYLAETQ